ncbi:MAG: glycosyltransferase [Deltaproteobacteria bacterium]|nr:glycosyltransferase [Deltaproteobacteria bacterium]
MSATHRAAVSRALFIGTVWPEPESSAAGIRTLGLIKALLQEGWEIHFLSPAVEKEFTVALRELGVQTRSQQANEPGFDRFVEELSPDVAIYDRFIMEEQFGWRVRENSPATLNVLDTIDLHFLRRGRHEALQAGQPLEAVFNAAWDFSDPAAPGHEDALREVGSIFRCDLTLMISDFELELLADRLSVPRELLLHLPFFLAPAERTLAPAFEQRAHFVSIGNFRHLPNADGVRWLKERIWPAIRKELPEVEAHVYGAYPSREMMDLTNARQGFHVHGPAPHAVETLRRYRVNLAPLRFGAGIKGKVADGWCAGAPTVTTPIGAEGMCVPGAEFAGAVERSEEAFARACVLLYRDAQAWSVAQASGFEAFDGLFAETRNARRFLDAISALRAKLPQHRSRNFMGSMLKHHFHQSTKYFSRWIEAKNR